MESAKFVGSIPQHYDRGLAPHIFEEYAIDLAQRVGERQPTSLLELAAGTGILTQQLRSATADSCEIVASDLNEPMLEIARSKLSDSDGIRFEQVDATDLPYADSHFDTVACQFGIMFFPDKLRSYKEVLRVLSSGGAYLFNVWGPLSSNPFARIAHEVAADFFPEDPPGFYEVPFSYNEPDEIRSTLSGIGFTEIVIEDVHLISQIKDSRRFATGLVYGNPLYQEVIDRDGDPDSLLETLISAIDRELGTEMPLHALFCTAIKP
jgi:ubiquinone/menaquinone biosynthesis C-methylase UbiE